jgi:hypothetical protein
MNRHIHVRDHNIIVGVGAGDVDRRTSAVLILQQVALHGSSKVDADALLPVVFRGRYDSVPEVAAIFKDVWNELGVSTSSSLILHGPVILAPIKRDLQAEEWDRRVQAAGVVAGEAAQNGEALVPFATGLMSLLLAQLPGRMWAGKAALVRAVGALAEGCRCSCHSLTVTASECYRPQQSLTGHASALNMTIVTIPHHSSPVVFNTMVHMMAITS